MTEYPIDNVPLPTLVQAAAIPIFTIRKFKAKCGSKLIVKVNGPELIGIEYWHECCAENCVECQLQAANVKILLESGK